MNNLQKIKSTIANSKTITLKEIAISLVSNFEDGADLVFDEALNTLRKRMNDADFVEFCEAKLA